MEKVTYIYFPIHKPEWTFPDSSGHAEYQSIPDPDLTWPDLFPPDPPDLSNVIEMVPPG